jgi:hypothetical protein
MKKGQKTKEQRHGTPTKHKNITNTKNKIKLQLVILYFSVYLRQKLINMEKK